MGKYRSKNRASPSYAPEFRSSSSSHETGECSKRPSSHTRKRLHTHKWRRTCSTSLSRKSGQDDDQTFSDTPNGDCRSKTFSHRKRFRSHRRAAQRGRRRSSSRRSESRSFLNEKNPAAERAKGGVKLFVGRLPRDVAQKQLRECFEEFGDVLEVFLIDSHAASNVGCAFVRIGTFEQAVVAIKELHEQRILVPGHRELGPMQVAFAKGEASRLGLNEDEEMLPSFKAAKLKVAEHEEKRLFFEFMQKRNALAEQAMAEQREIGLKSASVGTLSKKELVLLIKEGQRQSGRRFNQMWWNYCDQGLWGGEFGYNPSHHPRAALTQFVMLCISQYGNEPWFTRQLSRVQLVSGAQPPLTGSGSFMVPPLPPFGPGVFLPSSHMPFLNGTQMPGLQDHVFPNWGEFPGVPSNDLNGNTSILQTNRVQPERSEDVDNGDVVDTINVAPSPEEMLGRKLRDYTDADTLSVGSMSDVENLDDLAVSFWH